MAEVSGWRVALSTALAVVGIACTGHPDAQPHHPSHGRAVVDALGGATSPGSLVAPSEQPLSRGAPAAPAPHCAAPAIAGTLVEVGEVEAETPGLRCCTYLRRRVGASPSPASRIAFVQSGTGIYSTADGRVGFVAARALDDGFALLTMDKPGIAVSAKGQPVFDRDAYRQYTLADLVTCGRRALAWGWTRTSSVDPLASVTLHGHSEGGQMMIRMLAGVGSHASPPSPPSPPSSPSAASSAIHDREVDLDLDLGRVERTIVSGLPLEPFAVATKRQVAIFMPFEIEAFNDAIATQNDDYLLQHGLSTRYLTHPTAQESVEDVLVSLAERRPGFPLEMFHGDRDINAPIALVKSFASKNDRARKAGRPALDLRLHVYPGARHYLDSRFDADVRTLLVSHANASASPSAIRDGRGR